MSTEELLENLEESANDFMVLATQEDGAISGIAAECSQRLKDLHFSYTSRFRDAGALADEED